VATRSIRKGEELFTYYHPATPTEALNWRVQPQLHMVYILSDTVSGGQTQPIVVLVDTYDATKNIVTGLFGVESRETQHAQFTIPLIGVITVSLNATNLQMTKMTNTIHDRGATLSIRTTDRFHQLEIDFLKQSRFWVPWRKTHGRHHQSLISQVDNLFKDVLPAWLPSLLLCLSMTLSTEERDSILVPELKQGSVNLDIDAPWSSIRSCLSLLIHLTTVSEVPRGKFTSSLKVPTISDFLIALSADSHTPGTLKDRLHAVTIDRKKIKFNRSNLPETIVVHRSLQLLAITDMTEEFVLPNSNLVYVPRAYMTKSFHLMFPVQTPTRIFCGVRDMGGRLIVGGDQSESCLVILQRKTASNPKTASNLITKAHVYLTKEFVADTLSNVIKPGQLVRFSDPKIKLPKISPLWLPCVKDESAVVTLSQFALRFPLRGNKLRETNLRKRRFQSI
jgi:hypothetical protein